MDVSVPQQRLGPVPEPSIIAVIDDDADVRDATENLLQSFGFDTRAFGSATEFLTSGMAGCTACLVTDLQMPGLSGLDLLNEISRSGRSIPTIIVTAFPDERLRRLCETAGAIGFLSKPFGGDALVQAINRALSRG